jgi:hypothetical protein
LADRLQTDEIGLLALLVYRLMVKSGLQTCIDTHEADLALTDKNSIYDSDDYKSAFLQVIYDQHDMISDLTEIMHFYFLRSPMRKIEIPEMHSRGQPLVST